MPRIPAFGAAVLVQGFDPRGSVAVQELDFANPAPLDDLRAHLGGAADENLVERRAPDLIGEGQRFVPGVAELEFLMAPVEGGDELRAPFLHADAPYRLRHAQALEQRQIGRQERLADVEARMPRLFNQDDPIALLGQQDRGSGPCRSAAHHQNVAGGQAGKGVGWARQSAGRARGGVASAPYPPCRGFFRRQQCQNLRLRRIMGEMSGSLSPQLIVPTNTGPTSVKYQSCTF
jgi:hypothetical protein